jgi:hypothetical protein
MLQHVDVCVFEYDWVNVGQNKMQNFMHGTTSCMARIILMHFLEVCSFDPHSAWHTLISVLRPALPLCNILPFLRSLPDFWDISQPLWTLRNRKTQRPVGVPAVKFGAWLCQHDGARQRGWEHQRGKSTRKTKQPGEFFEAMYGNVYRFIDFLVEFKTNVDL